MVLREAELVSELPGGQCVKSFERSNGLDTAIYKNLPLPFYLSFSMLHLAVLQKVPAIVVALISRCIRDGILGSMINAVNTLHQVSAMRSPKGNTEICTRKQYETKYKYYGYFLGMYFLRNVSERLATYSLDATWLSKIITVTEKY